LIKDKEERKTTKILHINKTLTNKSRHGVVGSLKREERSVLSKRDDAVPKEEEEE
jgi:hypothetical protein|tara:strand:- start:173 stop:337 length:165 start_codon:yes stop_codon:yes gene_type:complete